MPSVCLRNRLISTWLAAPADCAAPGLDWLITDAWLHLRLQRPTAWLMLLLSKLVIWLQTCLVNPIWTKLVLRDGRTEAGDSRRDVAASSGIQPQDLFCSVKLVGIPSKQHLKKIFSSEDRLVPKCPSLEGVTASSFFFFFLPPWWQLNGGWNRRQNKTFHHWIQSQRRSLCQQQSPTSASWASHTTEVIADDLQIGPADGMQCPAKDCKPQPSWRVCGISWDVPYVLQRPREQRWLTCDLPPRSGNWNAIPLPCATSSAFCSVRKIIKLPPWPRVESLSASKGTKKTESVPNQRINRSRSNNSILEVVKNAWPSRISHL